MYKKLFRESDRQQQLADALMQRGLSGTQLPQMAVTPQYGVGHGLTDMAHSLLGGVMNKRAGVARSEAEEAKAKAMAEALAGMQGNPNPYAGAQGAIEAGVNPAIVGEALQRGRPQAGPTPTDDMREFEQARQGGFQGTFMDYMQAVRGKGTTVNVNGSVPAPASGFRNVFDEQGNFVSQEPIPGGPAALKQAEADEKANMRQETKERVGDVVADELNLGFELLDSESLPETGFIGNLLKDVPGTDANALKQRLMTVRSNLGFDRLQQMRESSPTGGALGNVTVQEIERLESVMGSLMQSQREDDLRYNMGRLFNIYQDTIHGPDGGLPRIPLQRPGSERKATPEQQSAPDFSQMTTEEINQWIAENGR